MYTGLQRVIGLLVVITAASTEAVGQFNPSQSAPVVTLTLTSSQAAPAIVAPNSTVHWNLVAEVSADDNLGLAGFFCSISECDIYNSGSSWQPVGILLSPNATPPSGMENFARPLGISSPANPSIPGSGFGGTPIPYGFVDGSGLAEVGGVQNTMGVVLPGATIGQSATLTLGVGQQPGGHFVASGTFVVPPLIVLSSTATSRLRSSSLDS